MPNPEVWILDIETSPLVVFVWDIKDQYIRHDQIIKDWDIMAWSAKKLGAPESSRVYYDRRKGLNDLGILKPLWKILDKADIIITQNGKSFDAKKITARFILHGMKPPSPYKHLDTFLIAKGVAAFTSHSLDYLTDKLNTKYKKLKHSKFPGMALWKACLNGKWVEQPWKNPEAWEEMKKYNIHDVLSTEELYDKLKPWAPKNMPKPFDVEKPHLQCRTCGVKGKIQKYGTRAQKRMLVQRLLCGACGAWDVTPIKTYRIKVCKKDS